MIIHRKIVGLLVFMIVAVAGVIAFFAFIRINDIQQNSALLLEEIEENAKYNVREEIQNLAENISIVVLALDADSIEDNLQKILENNTAIRSMNLFDINLMTLTSNYAENVQPTFVRGTTVPSGTTEIDGFFYGDITPRIFMDRRDARIYYPVIDADTVRYVLYIELNTANYFAMQYLIEEEISRLVRYNVDINAISLGTTLLVLFVFTVILSIMITKLVRRLEEAMEAANAASRAKSEFLSNMSHEIRTPMNSIMGFAELAQDDEQISLETSGLLEKIKESTKWLLLIINDILDISKIEAGKMELERVPFDLYEVVQRCQSATILSAEDKNLELIVYAQPLKTSSGGVSKKLIGDPVRLYQALLNLLSNAVKFTDAGTVKLSVNIKNIYKNGVTVYFEVKDTGIGMSAEEIEKMFDPFVQADAGTTRNYGGTGLGLGIAKDIVELMGGKLMAKSSPGAGSTFSFEITFETVDSSDDAFDNIITNEVEKPRFKGLVLIVDDNIMNQEVLSGHLKKVGLRTVIADNGKIAVDIVKNRNENGEKPFELIFMDILMPVMDGFEAASKITSLDTGTPIIAITANVMKNDLDEYKKYGMFDYIAKPFTAQELWRILLKYLTPVSISELSVDENEMTKEELKKHLQDRFLKNNKTKYDEITRAISSDDTDLARRLAHTLRGNAGFIGEIELQKAAAAVEDFLKDALVPVPQDAMEVLKTELTCVLGRLQELFSESQTPKVVQQLNKEQVLELLNKLEPMVKTRETGCYDFLDDLRGVEGAIELAQHIENFDFKLAAGALEELKKKWEENGG